MHVANLHVQQYTQQFCTIVIAVVPNTVHDSEYKTLENIKTVGTKKTL